MSAAQRLSQVAAQVGGGSTSDAIILPVIKKYAGESAGKRLQGKVAIVTGCDSPIGIGRATAHQFAANGCRALYICDVVAKHLSAHVEEISKLYPEVIVQARQFDAADDASVKAVVDEALKEHKRLDVFFANAGISGKPKHVLEQEAADWLEVMRVNTLSVFLAVKYAGPAMQITSASKAASCGSIIGTASVAGLRSGAGSTPYSASKAAVISTMQTSAWQLSGTNVRCNAICPGIIETGMTAPTYETARRRGTSGKIGQLNPTKRGAQPDEVARVALFLASDESSYVNAQAFTVDGGLSGSHPVMPGKMG